MLKAMTTNHQNIIKFLADDTRAGLRQTCLMFSALDSQTASKHCWPFMRLPMKLNSAFARTRDMHCLRLNSF